MTCRVRKYTNAVALERDTAALEIKHASNWLDEGLRHEILLCVAVRQTPVLVYCKEDWRNLLLCDAFHNIAPPD